MYVGGWKEAARFSGTRFCVLDEIPDEMPVATHVTIYDGSHDRAIVANLDRLTDAMKSAHDHHERVMVFCGHGVRRSPLAAAWYLHRVEELTLDEAYERIRRTRPQVEDVRAWVGNTEGLP